ncbi:Cp1, partial [Drosophila busckii]
QIVNNMFKIIAIFALVAYVGAASLTEVLNSEWSSFKSNFGRGYKSLKEELQRREIFISNKRLINEHNKRFRAGLESFEKGVNQFSDLTFEEFERLYLSKLNPYHNNTLEKSVFEPAEGDVPDSIDWRTKGAVTPVKDQGQCGSCWAFSANGALEGQWYLKTSRLISLSEQNLLDCSTEKYGNHGCNGGWPASALKYIIFNRGINADKTYPYEAKQGKCRFNETAIAATMNKIGYVASGDEDALKKAVATVGPISVAIMVTGSFMNYKSGVYSEESCPAGVNHGVVIVGYGTDANGVDYWLVKNSWGPHWGDKGYIRMSRNANNQCEIASYGVYTVL